MKYLATALSVLFAAVPSAHAYSRISHFGAEMNARAFVMQVLARKTAQAVAKPVAFDLQLSQGKYSDTFSDFSVHLEIIDSNNSVVVCEGSLNMILVNGRWIPNQRFRPADRALQFCNPPGTR